MFITLSAFEQKVAEALAKARFRMARKLGIQNKRIGPQSDEETDKQGIGAEMVYCKLMNVYPDLTIDGGRPLDDALLINGKTVDVKATKYKNGKLLVSTKKRSMPCDIYALMVGTFPTYRLAGHMTAEELFQNKRLEDLGHGDGYAANQEELFSDPDQF